MKKINFLLLAVLVLATSSCFNDPQTVFGKSLVEFNSTVITSPALGKTYPVITVTKGNPIATLVNLVAAQRPNPETVKYSVDAKESTAQAGVHYTLTDNGSIVFAPNTSVASTNIETKVVAGADVILVLILEGNETIKPSENYKRVGFRIR